MERQLTEEEKTLLEMRGCGVNFKQISEKLGVSKYRVNVWRTGAIEKLNAKNDVNAVYIALKRGLIKCTDYLR